MSIRATKSEEGAILWNPTQKYFFHLFRMVRCSIQVGGLSIILEQMEMTPTSLLVGHPSDFTHAT